MRNHAIAAVLGVGLIVSCGALMGALGLKAYSVSPGEGGVCGPAPVLEVRFSGLPVGAEVRVDGGRLPSQVSLLGSSVKAPVAVSLAEGPHTAEVVLRSPLRTVRRQWQFTVDTTPPDLKVSNPVDGIALASEETTVSGRAEPGATVKLDGEQVPAGPEGAWSFPRALKKGWNNFQVEAVDAAGNKSQATTRVFSDRESPTVRFLKPVDNGTVKASSFVLTAQGKDDGGLSSCNISVDGAPFKSVPLLGEGRLAFPLKKLAEGTHNVLLEVVDRAGRTDQREISFLVDSTEKLGEKTLILGARGADVKELQKRLVNIKFLDPSEITGVFDDNTLAAVQSFQSERDMEPDGVVGPSTLVGLGPQIWVNLGRFELVLDRPGLPLKRYSIACGMPAYPTPAGRFTVAFMERDPTWIPPPDSLWAKEAKITPPGPGNPLGTRWIGLSSGVVGIHGTNADYSIGSRASHGCIRMHISDVEDLYEYVTPGTPVTILDSGVGTKYWP